MAVACEPRQIQQVANAADFVATWKDGAVQYFVPFGLLRRVLQGLEVKCQSASARESAEQREARVGGVVQWPPVLDGDKVDAELMVDVTIAAANKVATVTATGRRDNQALTEKDSGVTESWLS